MKIRCRFDGLFRSAHVISLTYATEKTPATGPAKSAQTTAGAELAYAGMGYVGASGKMIHATAVATAEATSAGITYRKASTPRITSSENSEPVRRPCGGGDAPRGRGGAVGALIVNQDD